MGKRKFQLTEKEVQQLSQKLGQTNDARTCTRLQAVLWYGTGVPLREIQERLECSRASILGWCQGYRQAGAPGLESRWQGGNNARLTAAQIDELCAWLQTQTPRSLFGEHAATPEGLEWTVEDLHLALQRWYGVVYHSRSSYYRLLKKCLERQVQLSKV